jgi:5-methylcytosine-specific restriction endonuclease McrA
MTSPLLKTTRLTDRTAKKRAEEQHWREVCRLVEIRDGFKCRACGRKVTKTLTLQEDRLEHHHVKPLSLGGEDETFNVACLCLRCHQQRHVMWTLQITGNADSTLTFQQDGTEWFG